MLSKIAEFFKSIFQKDQEPAGPTMGDRLIASFERDPWEVIKLPSRSFDYQHFFYLQHEIGGALIEVHAGYVGDNDVNFYELRMDRQPVYLSVDDEKKLSAYFSKRFAHTTPVAIKESLEDKLMTTLTPEGEEDQSS